MNSFTSYTYSFNSSEKLVHTGNSSDYLATGPVLFVYTFPSCYIHNPPPTSLLTLAMHSVWAFLLKVIISNSHQKINS